ncbi:hypothetical protein J2X65_005141 [Ancylobacter sp. 3268]|uniref:hypothetical protein n=1 Tax=Ancylobacter sp. 3268 TaxID=2817752 RepID=UPI002865C9A8|nr:hypothetical protein [Ancylobacter sp. 3268]MDR6955758.1 hypothetical protein [Ancylobacter sp. 3268]
MQTFIIGSAICILLLAAGRTHPGSLIVALIASVAFGSTSIASLGGLGTPLIYVALEIVLIITILVRRRLPDELARIFHECPTAWIVLALLVYASGTAVILPRLFAGMTGAFVPVDGLVSEVPLAPVSGNIAQSGYFVLGGLVFFGLTLLLLARSSAPRAKTLPQSRERDSEEYLLLRAIGKGFFFWTWLNATAGALDLAGKLAGGGDLMLPLRTAGYALLTETEHAGFWRIAGLHPEASAFGAAALAGLAFSFTYWRATRSGNALILAIVLLSLTLLSTSSTAYAGLSVLVLVALLAAIRSLLRGRLLHTDAIWLGAVLIAVTVILAIVLINDDAFAKVETLLRATILEKSSSASGIERAYWNQRSLDSFFATSMFGIGLGSSRASSWAIAVLSQLGLIGSVLLGFLMATIAWPPHRGEWGDAPLGSERRHVIALHDSVRAAALTLLLAATIGGGAADPGVLFFISLATLGGCRRYLQRSRCFSTGQPSNGSTRSGSIPQGQPT